MPPRKLFNAERRSEEFHLKRSPVKIEQPALDLPEYKALRDKIEDPENRQSPVLEDSMRKPKDDDAEVVRYQYDPIDYGMHDSGEQTADMASLKSRPS